MLSAATHSVDAIAIVSDSSARHSGRIHDYLSESKNAALPVLLRTRYAPAFTDTESGVSVRGTTGQLRYDLLLYSLLSGFFVFVFYCVFY